MKDILPEYAVEAVSLQQTLLGLLLVMVLSLLLRWHFMRYSSVFANRSHLANILPLIAVTTLLVITVVKSSLALSLGLVGAMSIVRFRTPIKEPEELGYLFLAIGIGLGGGAAQFLPTTIVVVVILMFMTAVKRFTAAPDVGDFDFFVEIDGPVEDSSNLTERIVGTMTDRSTSLNLSKIEQSDRGLIIGATIGLRTHSEIVQLIDQIRGLAPAARCTFIDHKAVSL